PMAWRRGWSGPAPPKRHDGPLKPHRRELGRFRDAPVHPHLPPRLTWGRAREPPVLAPTRTRRDGDRRHLLLGCDRPPRPASDRAPRIPPRRIPEHCPRRPNVRRGGRDRRHALFGRHPVVHGSGSHPLPEVAPPSLCLEPHLFLGGAFVIPRRNHAHL